MTVRADDIAFGCFDKDLLSILERGPARAHRELLLAPIPMVKIHLEGFETTSAVRARHVPELTQERGGDVLASTDSLDFLSAIRRVIPDVRGSLIAQLGHAQE